MSELAAIEAKLDEAIACAVAKGWTLTPHVTRDSFSKECCPLGAVAVCNGYQLFDSSLNSSLTYGATIVGLPLDSVGAFVGGFDGARLGAETLHREVFDLGRKYRNRVLRARRQAKAMKP